MRASWLAGIKAARKDHQQIAASMEDGPWTAKEAKARGIVDAIGFESEARKDALERGSARKTQVKFGPKATREPGSGLAELIRVAKKFVVVSFTDRQSVQSFGRKLRGNALNPCAMAVDEITTAAERAGFKLEKLMTVSNIGPRHRYALLVRS